MNIFWVGFKNKKGIFLAILALFVVTISALGGERQAFADPSGRVEDYRYSTADCKKGGFEYQPSGGQERGCKVTKADISGGKVKDTHDVVVEGPELMSYYDSYILNKGGTCFQGFGKKNYNGIDVCERKGKKDKNTGYPPGRSSKDSLDRKKCAEIGGYWGQGGNVINRIGVKENCYLNNLDGKLEPFNNMSSLPSKYLTLDKCADGFIRSKNQDVKQFEKPNAVQYYGRGSEPVYTCAKKGTKAAKNLEKCNKEENKDSEECKENPTGEDDSDGSDDKNSCAIEWVGWIMCPVIRGANGMVVSTYSLMQQHFLNIKADEIFQQDKPAFKTWSSFRDIANVFFVIALSIIIFSQVSGVGISNYGIKKMLPKIIVFAILVNISWYISVIMIDISNIVGHSLFEWLSGDGTWQFSSDSQSEDSPVEQILGGTAAIGVGTAAAVTGALAAGSSILLFIFSAALALIMMIFILLIRQAAVIVLVVVSPVAFVAGILPNTEGFFKKWIKFFKNMLMIYPICSLIVGGAIFVSNLLYNNETNPLLKVAYGILPILSLFTIVAIIKSVLSIIDGLTGGNLRGTLDRMSGRLNDATANSRPMRRFKEWEGDRKIGGLAIGKNAREAKYQEGKAGRTYIKNRRELQRLQAKDNLTAAESRRYTQLGAENAKYERAQSEGMASAMASTIAGDVGAVDRHLQRISNVTDPVQQGLMYGAVAQAVNQAGLSAADRSAAMAKVVDGALQSDNPEQRQAAMRQIALNAGSEMKNINPAAAKALTQNTANKDNIKSVSDFEKDASTYAGASAQQMAGWSAMSSADSSNNQVLNAVKNAYASGDQKQISEAQNIAKVADQALKANEKGTMFLTPNQEKNFRAISAEAKANAPAAAAPTTPTPAPVPAGSQNMQVGVNYNVNNNSQTSQYGAPTPTQQVAVDQYKSNRRFGPQRSK